MRSPSESRARHPACDGPRSSRSRDWLTHQAALASTLATSSITCMNASIGLPRRRAFSAAARDKGRCRSRAVTTGWVSRRVRSISSASRAITGPSDRARSTRSKLADLVHARLTPGPVAAGLRAIRRERQRDRNRRKADAERADIEPEVALGVASNTRPPAQGPKRHAET